MSSVALRAQTGVGQIQGTVRDATGAVIPNASVALEHTPTHNQFQTTSSSTGYFTPRFNPALIAWRLPLRECRSGKATSFCKWASKPK